MKYNTNKEVVKLQGGKSVPSKYGNVSEIAQYNLENGTHFYTMDQVEQHKRESNPSFLSKLAQTTVKVPVTPGVSTSVATSLQNIPKVESTVGQELGYATGLLTSPMLLSEIGTYGPLVGGLRLAAGSAGAAGGSYVAGKAGDFADKMIGANWIGDTGRLLGGFAGFGAGMKTTTPLIRSAAGKGLTLHMPQNTFTNLRGQYFDRVANNIKLDNSIPFEMYTYGLNKTTYHAPLKRGSYKRRVDEEMWSRMHENKEFGSWNPDDIEGWVPKSQGQLSENQIFKHKEHFLDNSYDGRYTVTPEQGFIRRNQGGLERIEYIKNNPVKDLNATSAGETSIQEQIDLASRDFAKKYNDEFVPNFQKAVQYNALSDGTLGYTEGTILGPYVKHFGISPGQIKFAHTSGDTSILARLVESHEAHHATGNMDDSFVLRHLIEKGLIDETKLTDYLKDADRGEVTAHLSELPDWLGFTGRVNGKYTGHPFGKTNITSTDVYNFNKWNHNNGFKHTIWDAINKDKIQEFVKFMNEHPFVMTLPVAGIGGAAISKQKQGGILKGQNGMLTFEEWYKTIPKEYNDTTDYNLRRAYELVQFKDLEKWRKNPEKNHLNSVYKNENGDYEFLKLPGHPTLNLELDWYNKADKFKKKYQLDTTIVPWKYVHINKESQPN